MLYHHRTFLLMRNPPLPMSCRGAAATFELWAARKSRALTTSGSPVHLEAILPAYENLFLPQ